MASQKKQNRRLVSALLFVLFSVVLFVNNVTQLLANWFDLTFYQIIGIAWAGIIGCVVYTIYKVIGGEM